MSYAARPHLCRLPRGLPAARDSCPAPRPFPSARRRSGIELLPAGLLLARRRNQWRTISYCGKAVAEVFVTLIRPRRFRIRRAPCTADLDKPERSANCWRLTEVLRSSDL
jgi:hypothetical protein